MDDGTICTSGELHQALCKIAEKIIIVPANTKFLRRHSAKTAGGKESDTALDYYYVSMINDALRVIRKGGTGYIFNARQIADIKAFEPNAEFAFEDGAVAVRLAV